MGADVCVVGTGPVGQAVAARARGRGLSVVMIEAGGSPQDRRLRAASSPDGSSRRGRYADVSVHRTMAVGGTAHQWEIRTDDGAGVRMVSLAPSDFVDRGISSSPWPIGLDDLATAHREVSVLSGIDPDAGSVAHFAGPGTPALDLGAQPVRTRVFQVAMRSRFLPPESPVLADPGISVLRGGLVTGVEVDRTGTRVCALEVVHPGGRILVGADAFVLAGGTLGTTHLLLSSRSRHHGDGIGNHAGHLGRHFMDHPIVWAGSFRLDDAATVRDLGLYDLHSSRGARVWAKLVLDDDEVVRRRLLGAFTALFPFRVPATGVTIPWWDRHHPVGPRTGALAAARYSAGAGVWHRGSAGLAAAGSLAGGADDVLWYAAERLRNRLPRPHRHRGFNRPGWSAQDWRGADVALDLIQLCEQAPDPDNRIVLTDRLDPFGRPRFRVDWRWSDADDASIAAGQELVAEALDRTGLGRATLARRRGRVLMVHTSAHHHAGTARMSRRPEDGVVDPDGRVHGVDNLYVAGAAVMPTSGYANPTLTAMALGWRVGDRLLASDGPVRRSQEPPIGAVEQ